MEKTTVSSNVPATISYTKDDLARDVARKTYRPGWYAVVATSTITGTAKTGSLRLEQDYIPLKDANDTDSRSNVKVKNFAALPFKNPAAEHAVPRTTGIMHGMLRAFGGDIGKGIPDYPRKVEGTITFKGEVIDRSEYNAACEEVVTAVRDRLVEIWANPSMMNGYVVYAFVDLDDKGEFNRIKTLRNELPEGESVVAPDDWFKV